MTITPALLLDAVSEAAQVAGRVALSYFGRDVSIESKADGSPVTIADRRAEDAARRWIAQRFQGDEILGEELGTCAGSGRRWFIDPIDGTRTFVRGVPLWGTMIAVAVGDQVVAGAIYCPAVDELIAAAHGEGAHLNGVRCRVSEVTDISLATILATDARFRHNPSRVERWEALGSRVATSRTWGDCYGYLLVASGRAELMVDDRLNPWDVAALIPIVTEAGGVYSDWRGRTGVDGDDGFASNAALAGAFREALGIG